MTIRFLRRPSLAWIILSSISLSAQANTGLLPPPPVLLSPAAGAGAASSLGNAPYLYHAARVPLSTVLNDFVKHFGLRLEATAPLNGIVNGRLNGDNPSEFVERLGGMYGFDWLIQDGSLFISPIGERRSKTFNVPSAMISRIKPTLTGMGLFDTRYGWGEAPEQGAIIVSGPPAYLRFVERAIRSLEEAPSNQQVALVRLRYASVIDRTVNDRNEKVTIPGLATTLRSLLGSGSVPTTESKAGENKAEPSPRWITAPGGVSIEAEPRLNAIVLKAPPELLPSYRKLIEDLDQPTRLVQIEATIIEVEANYEDALGVKWNGGLQKGDNTFSLEDKAGDTSGSKLGIAKLSLNTIISRNLNLQLMARISALAEKGHARIISKPSILTTDNMGALLDLSETFFVRNKGERAVETKQYSAGLKLKVTPRVLTERGHNKVSLLIDIEDGTITQHMIESLPTIRSSTISTQATVGDTQSLLIAGHQVEKSGSGSSNIPGLSKIPLIGGLFSEKTSQNKTFKRYFLITPSVVDPEAANAQAEQLIKTPPALEPIDEKSDQKTQNRAVSTATPVVEVTPLKEQWPEVATLAETPQPRRVEALPALHPKAPNAAAALETPLPKTVAPRASAARPASASVSAPRAAVAPSRAPMPAATASSPAPAVQPRLDGTPLKPDTTAVAAPARAAATTTRSTVTTSIRPRGMLYVPRPNAPRPAITGAKTL